jgi:putative FmdB family regulatory protein
VPTYEYQCDQCRRTFEIRQRITAEPLTRCEACGGALRRLLSPAPFILKGEGWYVTDYPSEARKKGKEAEKGTVKTDTKDTKDAASGEKSSTSPPKDTSTPTKDTAPTTGSAASSSPTTSSSA